ncbi:MAG: nucleotidyl transferase AbiEii/AbiGii toxin family protein [Burkholderiales bacterium]
MSDTLLRISKPLDPLITDILQRVDAACVKTRVSYFVIGAMARDIVLTNVFDIDTGRATRDVDFAIAVKNWNQFDSLKQRLLAEGQARADNKTTHRIFMGKPAGIPVDIVPYGKIAEPGKAVAWPPGGDTRMNVTGFAEAAAHALRVKLKSKLFIPVASLPGLAVLKLLAWADRRNQTKDATDLGILFRYYERAGNQNRLYDEHADLLEAFGYDPELAGAALLGQDAKSICLEDTYRAVAGLLKEQTANDEPQDLALGLNIGTGYENPQERARQMLSSFAFGFLE